MNSYIGIGDPNGVVYGYIGAAYFDTASSRMWTKREETSSPYVGWEPDPDTP